MPRAWTTWCLLTPCLITLTGLAQSVAPRAPLPVPRTESAPILLYAPQSNLERSELEVLRMARVSIDVATYSFTDRELAQELARLARSGVQVRVYRDSGQYQQESQRGLSTSEILLSAGVQVRVEESRDLMHLKSYAIDGALLRTGSANWSPTGLKRQDNDLRYEVNPALVKLFQARFAEMWDRPNNHPVTCGRVIVFSSPTLRLLVGSSEWLSRLGEDRG